MNFGLGNTDPLYTYKVVFLLWYTDKVQKIADQRIIT